MTIAFTFAVFCQTLEEDFCFGGERLVKFMDAIDNSNLLEEYETGDGFGNSKLKLLEFDVYASENRPLGDLRGIRYGRPIFVGMAEGDIIVEDITKVESEAMTDFRNFLKAIFSSKIVVNLQGDLEPYRDFPVPPDPDEPRDFSWVIFLVQDKQNYNFKEFVGPGHSD